MRALRRHPVRAARQPRSWSSGSGFGLMLVGLPVGIVALIVTDGDPRALKALVGAAVIPAFVAWAAGIVALNAERRSSRLLAAVIAVVAVGVGVWLTAWVLDKV